MLSFLKKSNKKNIDTDRLTYSQTGEDAIVNFWINKSNGIYIDVGANDPIHLNNTYLFYLKGWRGINIEPDPTEIEKLKKVRPDDINLQLGISKSEEALTYYKFLPSTLSTFSNKESLSYQKNGYELVEEVKVKTATLKDICGKYLKDKNIDILSIDVEGLEEEVIQSNDWNLYRPTMIILETVNHNPSYKLNAKLDKLMLKFKYVKFADTYINTIYASQEFLISKNINI